MNSTQTLRPLPMRRVVLSLTDGQLNALDTMSAFTGEPRTVLLRQAVDLFVLMHGDAAETLATIFGIVAEHLETEDPVGETKGTN